MQYSRSGTALDHAGAFMPQKLLGIGRFSGRRNGNMRGLGFFGDDVVTEWSGYDSGTDMSASSTYAPASYYPTDQRDEYFTAAAYYPARAPYAPPYAPPATVSPSSATDFNWSQLPAMARDIFIAVKTGEAQSKLMDINMERARRGQTPIDASRYMPGVNVGLTQQARNLVGGLGAGTLILGAAGLYFLTRKRK